MRKNGFTLIELIVAIVILLLFTGSGVITMNNFNDKQKLLGVRGEIKSMLELTRNYASTMQYAQAAADGVVPSYYRFTIEDDLDGKIFIKYNNDDDGEFTKNNKSWANQGVTISGDRTICFKPFDVILYALDAEGICTTTAETDSQSIVLARGVGETYQLVIDQYGKISEINP
jgi:prepilin-type N-terminal cleavage/methylation domain-containing protein